MNPRIILNATQFKLTIDRLCHQLIENHGDFNDTVLVGVQPRGVFLAQRLAQRLQVLLPDTQLSFEKLDITFYRDDFRTSDKPLTASETTISTSLEDKRIVLVDDVLYTGRTIRSAMDALLDYGRPRDVELLVLIDRRLHRDLPIQAKYSGRVIDSIQDERVNVEWVEQGGEDKIWITSKQKR